MKRNDIIEILRKFQAEYKKKYSIQTIGIFRSAAHDSFHDRSDIDVLVELENPDLFNLIGIKQDLEERFDCSVDIVRYPEKVNASIKRRIDQRAVYAWQKIDKINQDVKADI